MTIAPGVVVAACAASAGIHAGLVPSHLAEEPPLGVAFGAAVVLLTVVAAAVRQAPHARAPLAAAAITLALVIAAYAASRSTGLPVLGSHREPVDALGLGTQAVQAVGLVAALHAYRSRPLVAPVTRKESR